MMLGMHLDVVQSASYVNTQPWKWLMSIFSTAHLVAFHTLYSRCVIQLYFLSCKERSNRNCKSKRFDYEAPPLLKRISF